MLSETKSRLSKKSFIQISLIIFFIGHLTVYPQVSDFKGNNPTKRSFTDWSYTIDTTWGTGLSTAQKLQVFDAYWNKFDQTWGGFPNLDVDWDSLKIVYRSLVEAGVSRGRFYGILCRMSHALN